MSIIYIEISRQELVTGIAMIMSKETQTYLILCMHRTRRMHLIRDAHTYINQQDFAGTAPNGVQHRIGLTKVQVQCQVGTVPYQGCPIRLAQILCPLQCQKIKHYKIESIENTEIDTKSVLRPHIISIGDKKYYRVQISYFSYAI